MSRSIEDLEGMFWPEPDFTSGLVVRAHALRKKPVDALTAGDLRVAFGQDIGTKFAKDRLLEVLSANPSVGELFDGDLIRAVMMSQEFCRDEAFRAQVKELAGFALERDLDDDTRREIEKARNA